MRCMNNDALMATANVVEFMRQDAFLCCSSGKYKYRGRGGINYMQIFCARNKLINFLSFALVACGAPLHR